MQYKNSPNEQEFEEIKTLLRSFLEETIKESNLDNNMYDEAINFAFKRLCDLVDEDERICVHYLQEKDEIISFAITIIDKFNGVGIGDKYIWYVSPKYRSEKFKTQDSNEQYAIKYINSNIDNYFKEKSVKIEKISASLKNKKNILKYFELGYIPEKYDDERVLLKKIHGYNLSNEDNEKIKNSIETNNIILTDLRNEENKLFSKYRKDR